MSVDDVVRLVREGLFVIIKTAAPVLLVSLIVGLLVSIFQTVTSIQEQTLTFVPKVIAVFLTIMIAGDWMMNNMMTYMTDLWSQFSLFIR